MAILVLFWGWWRLGRSFSISPLEFAKAILPSHYTIPSPCGDGVAQSDIGLSSIFATCSSNASVSQLVDHVCQGVEGADFEPMVQYGVIDGTDRLGFALRTTRSMRKPREGDLL
ncbi:hypothetical protein QBC32DRAFT_94157 [Pseudoneurospora amorphoporcata]|uniref:Uncharacterized protein n=1 Tax=Pseudoneurospora amorphoporcata TaxID=241081 RepID=A0AAN6NJY5_9PEZI|nr:hypothetical protein QBC32DRAFT_94157 [Pseudoneurospora amorphoporcata]